MSVDPQTDDSLQFLLQEIAKNIIENQRFLQILKEDRSDGTDDSDELADAEEDFEEL